MRIILEDSFLENHSCVLSKIGKFPIAAVVSCDSAHTVGPGLHTILHSSSSGTQSRIMCLSYALLYSGTVAEPSSVFSALAVFKEQRPVIL